MKQFLMLVGVAAVAGAMYVAAASGSQQAKFATQKEVAVLQKDFKRESAELKATQSDLNSLALAYVHCSLPSEIAVYRNGGSSYGYEFQGGTGAPFFTTALDIAPGPSQANWELTPFNSGDTECQSLIGAAAARHNATSVIAQQFAGTR